MIVLLVAMLTPTPSELIADIMRLQVAYKTCLTEQSVQLGRSNSESADTILRGVDAVCRPVETQLRAVYAETPMPRSHTEMLMDRDRKLGEDAGIAALLQVRSGSR